MNNIFAKSPSAVKDYKIDWSLWLPAGEVISSSSWIINSGLSQGPNAASFTATTCTVWLAGGAAGQTYRVINRIVTNLTATTEDQSIFIEVIQE